MSPGTIKINRKLCKQCSICVKSCPRGVYQADQDGGPMIAAQDKCSRCGLCVFLCPDLAIELED